MMAAPLLAVHDLRKVYTRGLLDRTPTFRLQADFVVPEPTVVGVMGPNGSGKTTLFELITGSNQPSAGRVVTAGQVGQTRRIPVLPGLGAAFGLEHAVELDERVHQVTSHRSQLEDLRKFREVEEPIRVPGRPVRIVAIRDAKDRVMGLSSLVK